MKKKINYNYITQIMNHEKKFSDSKKRMVREKFFNKLSEKMGKESERIQKGIVKDLWYKNDNTLNTFKSIVLVVVDEFSVSLFRWPPQRINYEEKIKIYKP